VADERVVLTTQVVEAQTDGAEVMRAHVGEEPDVGVVEVSSPGCASDQPITPARKHSAAPRAMTLPHPGKLTAASRM
jgi:hypothetical protein